MRWVVHVAVMRDEINTKFWSENLKRYHLGDLGLNDRIILKYSL
jgi:hypothetical protein